MIRAQKIRLHPTPEQANYFARTAGVGIDVGLNRLATLSTAEG
jgi:Helix-turn-helix domain